MMGNSESNCCDLLKDGGETKKCGNKESYRDSKAEDTNSNNCVEEKLSVDLDKHEASPQNKHSKIILDDTHTLASTTVGSNVDGGSYTDKREALELITQNETPQTPQSKSSKPKGFDPRSPSSSITRTPIAMGKIMEQDGILDPRSPSIGVDRTPIVIKEKVDECLSDPRSPTAGVERTPIIIQSLEDAPIVNGSKDLHDPRSPTTEVYRTPMRVSYNNAGNLRRTVLLTNTLMSSPNTRPVEKDDSVEGADQHVPTITLEESSPTNGENEEKLTQNVLLNLSCASNLNTSLSSSMIAVLGSDSRSVNFDDMSDTEFNSCNVSMEDSIGLDEVKDVLDDLLLDACITESTESKSDFVSISESNVSPAITAEVAGSFTEEIEIFDQDAEDGEEKDLESLQVEANPMEIEQLLQVAIPKVAEEIPQVKTGQNFGNTLEVANNSPVSNCGTDISDVPIVEEMSVLDGELYQANKTKMEDLKNFLQSETPPSQKAEIDTNQQPATYVKLNKSMEIVENKSSPKITSGSNKKTSIPMLSTSQSRRSSYASSGKKAQSAGSLGHVILKDPVNSDQSPIIREASFSVFKHSDSKSLNRTPLAVLGHCNSPETKGRSKRHGNLERLSSTESAKATSRVPRYRGSVTRPNTPSSIHGKEN
ncbi:uncharacterized protein LOC100176363 [Ciona intestinalis]